MSGQPLSSSPTIKALQLTQQQLTGEVVTRLDEILEILRGNPPVELPDIYNTLAGSTLPAGQVEGFMELATAYDNRLIALGF